MYIQPKNHDRQQKIVQKTELALAQSKNLLNRDKQVESLYFSFLFSKYQNKIVVLNVIASDANRTHSFLLHVGHVFSHSFQKWKDLFSILKILCQLKWFINIYRIRNSAHVELCLQFHNWKIVHNFTNLVFYIHAKDSFNYIEITHVIIPRINT